MREADAVEAEVWDGLVKQDRFGVAGREALALIDRALGLREAAQGPEHADLIWPLALKMELLRFEGSREGTLAAALAGERRLALQRLTLRDAPAELVRSLQDLVRVYTFEDEVLDPARVKALEDEIQRLDRS